MKHYEWSELDYIAGAAHVEGMSYGRFVSIGMPNLQRFKNRVAAGEFDNKPVKARSRAEKPKEPKAEPAKEKKGRDSFRPAHLIPAGTCQRCGAIIPAENRPGPTRRNCAECARDLRNKRQRDYGRRVRHRKNAGETKTGQFIDQQS